MNSALHQACIVLLAGLGTAYAQTLPASVTPEPAPIGIAVNQSTVLFSQPYCDGVQPGAGNVARGVYTLNGTAPIVPLPPSSSCTENYFADSLGFGGFPSGELYIAGLSNGSPVIFQAPASGGSLKVFASLPVATSGTPHTALSFDTIGTFGFNLIATGTGGVQGYNASGTKTFFYPNPNPAQYYLEGSTVAPQSYTQCPGCLFIVAAAAGGFGSGGIYVVKPGSPSGTVPQFFAAAPVEPEGIVFVPSNPCTYNGDAYFVSAYSQSTGNPLYSNGGAVLGFTAAQLANYAGQFLVPDEVSGVIYAYNGSTSSVFSSTGDQLEGSTMVACPVQTSATGFMTGGGQMANFGASHGMELGCSVNSNHHTLEVNWAGGNQFHLETMSSVSCYMDPAFPLPGQPPANFNTLVMTGTGKYDGQEGATVSAIFTDGGEPGTNDQAMIVVQFNGQTVLQIPLAKIATGNQQAHK